MQHFAVSATNRHHSGVRAGDASRVLLACASGFNLPAICTVFWVRCKYSPKVWDCNASHAKIPGECCDSNQSLHRFGEYLR